MSTFPLDPIVDIVVDIAEISTPKYGFNTGLILGESEVIPPEERVRVYSSTDELAQDFPEDADEAAAARLYFAQAPAPRALVVGRREADESITEALAACRAKNDQWYGFAPLTTETAEVKAAALWAMGGRAVCFYTQDDPASALFADLKAQDIRRALGLYSATPHAACAVMGFAMGAMNDTASSAYTLAYKSLSGVAPDSMTSTQLAALKAQNANVYIERAGGYKLLEQGVTADGTPFDEVIGLDRLTSDVQIAVMDVLSGTRTKVPYTNAGMVTLNNAVEAELERARSRGFIAPGLWTGPNILQLNTGDALPSGYLVQAGAVEDQPAADRAKRKAPPIYVCVKLAGAVEHVAIRLNVER